jgi:hypothetical protein
MQARQAVSRKYPSSAGAIAGSIRLLPGECRRWNPSTFRPLWRNSPSAAGTRSGDRSDRLAKFTLAALINLINSVRNDHVVTIEDPSGSFLQPGLGHQADRVGMPLDFATSVRASSAEPDVIPVGEMRDADHRHGLDGGETVPGFLRFIRTIRRRRRASSTLSRQQPAPDP